MSTVSSNDNVDRQQIIITIDVGSSSVRSSAYALHSRGSLSPSMASASRPQRSVQPNTGRVVLNGVGDCPSVMDLVDQCIDETLQELRERFDRDQWEVLGIGFSTFVMNLVGVSADGEVVGEEASISYACNTAEVAEEVQALKRYV
jgi:gluconokinase